MNKGLKIVSIVFIVIYVFVVLFSSLFIIMENDYGITKCKDNYYVIINKKNENGKSKDGMLVVVKDLKIKDIKENDEVFLYKSDSNNKVYVGPSIANKVYAEEDEPYITVENELSVYREDSVLGKSVNKINGLGKIIEVLTKKWVFLVFMVIPCCVLAVYIIYTIIKYISMKNEKEEE